MLLSAVSVLVVAQSSSEIPEGLMNHPVHTLKLNRCSYVTSFAKWAVQIATTFGVSVAWFACEVYFMCGDGYK